MKRLILIFLIPIYLQASLFGINENNEHTKKQLIEKYRNIASLGNSISKRGQYIKYEDFKTSLETLHADIKKLDIDPKAKNAITDNISDYKDIISALSKNMDLNSPQIDKHYKESLDGLVKFNQLIHSTGYAPLLGAWEELTNTKHRYLKKPSQKLAKQFHNHFKEVKLVLEDLCLDEELEDPMIGYLKIYEQYFNELDASYKKVEYANIRKLKQLSYEVKSKLTLIIN